MTDKINNSSCCALPFMHVQTDPDGKIKLCCLAKNYVRDHLGKPYNFGTDKIEDFYNSKYMQNVRKNMLNNVKVPDCSLCYNEEAAGGISQRQVYTKEWLEKDPTLQDRMLECEQNNYKVDPKVQYFDFRFGNMCNLKCRSCGPINSIQILKDAREINHPQKYEFFMFDEKEIDSINDWYQTETFMENFKSQEGNVKQIYFTGGEPTIIEQNYQILQELVDRDKAKDISLIFSSNMTNIQDRFISLIDKFKHVKILASCEGYGDMHEYLRFPANWKVFEKNINRLAEMDPNKISIFCTPVVQSVNLDRICEFFKWIDDINSIYNNRRIQTLPIVLTFPEHLDLEILPLAMKQRSLAKLEEFIENTPRVKYDQHFLGRINMIREKCNKDAFNPALLKKFKTFTELLDSHRKQNLSQVNPELAELLMSL